VGLTTFQFDGRHLFAGLSAVLRAFDRGDDGWLASPHAALDGERPIDHVRTARDLDRVVRLAADASRRRAS
jgi:hypothetical protein